MADPGFFQGGAPTPKSVIIFQFFRRKLSENERIWTPWGRPWRPPPGTANAQIEYQINKKAFQLKTNCPLSVMSQPTGREGRSGQV